MYRVQVSEFRVSVSHGVMRTKPASAWGYGIRVSKLVALGVSVML